MRATDSLETLLSVQTLDKKLADLERRRDEIPSVKADVSREITALEHERAEQAEALEQVRLDRRRHEGELEMQQEHLARYERQLNDVKTNVAYSALLTEIQGTRRAIGELETEILEEMERRETIDIRIREIDAELELKRAAAADKLKELDEEHGSVEREMAALDSRRNGMVSDDLSRISTASTTACDAAAGSRRSCHFGETPVAPAMDISHRRSSARSRTTDSSTRARAVAS